ncbi:uncharacterized protein LOC109594850 [Aethina tumida]|uniref:uncharacterized protein LOC109594850 n=1 Tax=Aethina tumida TaxID=116153 RepID=UPI00096ADF83|nr:uncharacterized protein LOC109594850 [Aethina tumida]XP_049817611.1 uncharacterized protein LOC109594850 [Aethina tumida]XP_049817612.1 uncharacterized protein LOC109594850 [Aethina tumida]XP_049817613.1 uncharacterized protein LOC109594850 [Aethina tumida]
MKIAVIGAGVSGLAAAKCCLEEGHDVVVFEQTGSIGGTWVYTDKIGLDENGLPVHSSMYRGLRTNIPKELMEFDDFHYPETLKQSYVGQEQVLAYLEDFTKHFSLGKHIKLHHQVTEIEVAPEKRWRIDYRDVRQNAAKEEIFDAVMICNGHYFKPFLPEMSGLEKFSGTVIHSHSYRSAEPYKNKRVVIVGAGPSGVDIAKLVSKVAAKVYISFQGQTFGGLDKLVEAKPRISQVNEKSVLFGNSEEVEVDSIIFCTGYCKEFPFLNKNCEIEIDDGWVMPLFKQIININHPTMAIIGLPNKVCPFPMGEYQSKFFLAYLKGNFKLSKEEMLADMNADMELKRRAGIKKKNYHVLGDLQGYYWDTLAVTAKIKRARPVLQKLYTFHKLVMSPDVSYKIVNDNDFTYEFIQ